MRTLIILSLVLFCFNLSDAQNFSSKLIKPQLKKNADVVIREYSVDYEHISTNKLIKRVNYAVTILNKNGEAEGNLIIPYNKCSKVQNIEGALYDANGIQSYRLKNSDIRDFSYYADFTFYSDTRVKYAKILSNTYPYTAVYKYEVVFDGFVGIDPWMPLKGYAASLENASLSYRSKPEIDIKYKVLNGDFSYYESKGQEFTIRRWEIDTIPAFEYEVFSPYYLDIFPAIMLSPTVFEYEGTQGNLSDWQTCGKWIYGLIHERDLLTQEVQNEVLKLTDRISQPREKALYLYKYMQSRTRYVNISLGIGGYQPMYANDVHEVGYGDCKALTIYTKALLKLVGIESYFAIIGSGNYQQIKFEDYADIYQANHAILCVPFPEDTIWLECTSQKAPFGFLGSSSCNRKALIIKREGGEFATTSSYKSSLTNIEKINISEDGAITATAEIRTKGNLYERVLPRLYMSEQEQINDQLKATQINGMKIESYSIADESTDFPVIVEKLTYTSDKYASKLGKRLMVGLSLRNSLPLPILDTVNVRQNDVFIPHYLATSDSLVFTFPSSLVIEYAPESLLLNTQFGYYKMQGRTHEQTYILTRAFALHPGTYERTRFNEFAAFLNTVTKNHTESLILTTR